MNYILSAKYLSQDSQVSSSISAASEMSRKCSDTVRVLRKCSEIEKSFRSTFGAPQIASRSPEQKSSYLQHQCVTIGVVPIYQTCQVVVTWFATDSVSQCVCSPADSIISEHIRSTSEQFRSTRGAQVFPFNPHRMHSRRGNHTRWCFSFVVYFWHP